MHQGDISLLPELGEPDKSFHNLWDEEEEDDDDEGEVERLPPPHSGLLKWTVLKSIDGNDEECRAFKAWREFQQSISGVGPAFYCHEAQGMILFFFFALPINSVGY